MVVNAEGLVFGELDAHALEEHGDLTAEEAMIPGPTTFRPNTPVGKLAESLPDEVDPVIVTSSDGRLMGIAIWADILHAAEREGKSTGN